MLKKRGLSPLIATMLLIAIALVLAVIIFVWGKSFLGENIQKNLGDGPEPIEVACDQVKIQAEAELNNPSKCNNGLSVNVVNRGNIPIYKFEVRESSFGSIKTVNTATIRNSRTLSSGDDSDICVNERTNGDPLDIQNGDTLVIVPIILGEKGDTTKGYPCDKNSLELTVGG